VLACFTSALQMLLGLVSFAVLLPQPTLRRQNMRHNALPHVETAQNLEAIL